MWGVPNLTAIPGPEDAKTKSNLYLIKDITPESSFAQSFSFTNQTHFKETNNICTTVRSMKAFELQRCDGYKLGMLRIVQTVRLRFLTLVDVD